MWKSARFTACHDQQGSASSSGIRLRASLVCLWRIALQSALNVCPRAPLMAVASELRAGMAVRIEGQIYKVLEAEFKTGAGQAGGVVRTKLRNAETGRIWEPHFRADERLEELELERQTMEFLYSDADNCTFMNPETGGDPARDPGACGKISEAGDETSCGVFRRPAHQHCLPGRRRSPRGGHRAAGALAAGQHLEGSHPRQRLANSRAALYCPG